MADSQATRVHDFVNRLNQTDRYIVLLYYADGLTPMEISQVLELPSRRVSHRLEELGEHLTGLAQKRKPTPAASSISAYA